MAPKRLINSRSISENSVTYFDIITQRSHKLMKKANNSDQTSIKVIDVLLKHHKYWQIKFNRLKERYIKVDSERNELKTSKDNIQNTLQHESDLRQSAEDERDSLKRKLDIIKDVVRNNNAEEARRRLNNLDSPLMCEFRRSSKREHSAGSLLDQSKISEEDICETNYRRTSVENVLIGQNLRTRSSNSGNKHIQETDMVTQASVDSERTSIDSSDSYFDVEMERGISFSPYFADGDHRQVVRKHFGKKSQNDTATSLHPGRSDMVLRARTPTVNRLNRPHNFVSRSLLRMECCDVCGRRIAFGKPAYKCSVCRLVVHSGCNNRLTQTCVPPSAVRTPLSSVTNQERAIGHNAVTPTHPHRAILTPHSASLLPFSPFQVPGSPTLPVRAGSRTLNLADWCPVDQQPRVPALIIHCANEIGVRGLGTVGIYRVSGSGKQISDLYEKFMRSKMTPGLARVEDIHVVCGCLKLFLRNLSEPLVTYELRPNLQVASEQPAEVAMDAVLNVLSALPVPNRDTLSFVMLHLKDVARSPACQMDKENLAKVFGPTLVGYSCREPQVMQTLTETGTQQAVVKLLFSVPDQIYSGILWRGSDEQHQSNALTSNTFFGPLHSLIQSPSDLGSTPRRKAGFGVSSRRRFVPSFLQSQRHETADSGS